MVTFVIFWASVLAIICFIFKIVFKVLDSAFKALLSAAGFTLRLGGIAVLVILAIYLLYKIVDGVITSGFETVIGEAVLLLIEFGMTGALTLGVGSFILEIVALIADYIIDVVSYVLVRASDICENGYSKFLAVIMKSLNKC